jgi:hypothetical protein
MKNSTLKSKLKILEANSNYDPSYDDLNKNNNKFNKEINKSFKDLLEKLYK